MTLNPYVIDLRTVVNARILVYAPTLDDAHERMHDLEDGYFDEIYAALNDDPEKVAPTEHLSVRSALVSEARDLTVGEVTFPTHEHFHSEDEKQVLAYMADEDDE